MSVTNFIWDEVSENVLFETNENGAVTASYTNRPEQFEKLISQERSGVTSYFHYDGEHSTRQLTDSNGNVTDTFIYTAYGEEVARTGVTTNPFGFRGAVGYYTNSATNDIYVRPRTYQPVTGRWLSMDPLGFVDGPNLYRAYFVPGNTDPEGTKKVCCTFDNGSRIWSETYNVGDNESPLERCKRRATWGLGKDWKVLGARFGACGAPKPPGPVVVAPGATCVFNTADACVPEPTDFFPPKWVCYAVVGTVAGIITYQCCKNIDPCWSDCEGCLLSSPSGRHNRCWDCYLACSGLGVWTEKVNGIDCAYWKH